MEQLGSRIKKGLIWSFGKDLIGRLVSFISIFILAKLLGPGDFGTVASFLVFVSVLSIFAQQGFGHALVQRDTICEKDCDTAMGLNVVLGIAAYSVLWVSAPMVCELFSVEGSENALRCLGLVVPINSIGLVASALLRREMRFKELALRESIAQIVGAAVGISLAIRGDGVMSLVWQQVSSAIVLQLVLFWFSRSPIRIGFHLSSARWLWRYGVNIVGDNVLNLVTQRSDRVIIGLLLGPQTAGIYTLASELVLRINQFIVGTLSAVAFPLFSRLAKDRDQLTGAFFKVVSCTVLVGAPIFLGLSSIADRLIPVTLGHEWDEVAPILSVLSLNGTLFCAFFLHSTLFNAVGRPEITLGLSAMHAAGNLIAFAIASRWGVMGIASAYVGRALLTSPVHVHLVAKTLGVSPWRYVMVLAAPTGLAILMLLICLVAKTWTGRLAGWSDLGVASSTIIVGIISYGALAVIWLPQLTGIKAMARARLTLN